MCLRVNTGLIAGDLRHTPYYAADEKTERETQEPDVRLKYEDHSDPMRICVAVLHDQNVFSLK